MLPASNTSARNPQPQKNDGVASPSILITIAIPTFNRARVLGHAIESALKQTHIAIEVIVCDNASTDDTEALLNRFNDPRLRVVRQTQNVGLLGNWNACLALVRGEYFLMLSDDDRLVPTAVSDLLASMRKMHDLGGPTNSLQIAFAYGRCEILFQQEGTSLLSRTAPSVETSISYQIGVLEGKRVSYPSATLLRTRDVRAAGGYSKKYAAAFDIGLLFEISCDRPYVAYTQTTTTYYLMHLENFTSTVPLSALYETVNLLSAITSRTAAGDSPGLVTKANIVVRRAAARAIANEIVDQRARGSLSNFSAIFAFFIYRNIFLTSSGFIFLAKAFLKIIFGPIIFWLRPILKRLRIMSKTQFENRS